MQICKAIYENNPRNFEENVNEYLEKGYKLSSSSCSTVNQKEYEASSTIYQAILVKDED